MEKENNQGNGGDSSVLDSNISPRRANRKQLTTFLYITVSFLCALILWFYVIGYNSPDYEKTFTGITVDVVGETELFNDKGYTVLIDGNYTIDVTVVGKKSDVVSLRNSDIVASVDVSAISAEGNQDIAIEIDLPNGIGLVNKSTDFWNVRVEKKTARTIEIEVSPVQGSWETYLELDFVCTPTVVTVEGSSQAVNGISSAVVYLDLGKIENPTTAKGVITLLDKSGAIIDDPSLKLSTANVNVYISVLKEKEVPVRVEFTAGVFSVNDAVIHCDPSSVTIKGDINRIDAIDEIVIGVDETTVDGSVIIKYIPVPDEVTIVSEKVTANITATLVDVASRKFEVGGETVTIKGLSAGLGAKVLTEKISVNFKGYTGTLRDMTEDSFSIVADMTEFDIIADATYRIPVKIEINPGVLGVFTTDDSVIEVFIEEVIDEGAGTRR